jgi:AraC-like DNA-binding protein
MDNVSISEAIDVSPNYLTKIFQNFLGYSLHQYVIRFRIEKAEHLLKKYQVNITEAAINSGFSSIHVFSKIFKIHTGMTPSEYVNNLTYTDKSKEKDSREKQNEEAYIFYNV